MSVIAPSFPSVILTGDATHPEPDANPSVALELGLSEYRVGQAVVRSHRLLLRLRTRGPEAKGGAAEPTQQRTRYMPIKMNSPSRQGKPAPRNAFQVFKRL